jgi:quinol monooxygenase YgiN
MTKAVKPNAVKIVAILVAKPGKAGGLKALLDGMVAPCRAEPGNLRWDVWQDQANPDRFVLDELYTDMAAIAAHRETPHFKNYFAHINDLADRTPLVLDAVHVA